MRNDSSGTTSAHPTGRRPVVAAVFGADPDAPLQSTIKRSVELGPIVELKIFDQKFVFVAGNALAAELAERLMLMPSGFGLRFTPRQQDPAASEDQVKSEMCPDSSIDQPGFQATSQGWPSGSAK